MISGSIVSSNITCDFAPNFERLTGGGGCRGRSEQTPSRGWGGRRRSEQPATSRRGGRRGAEQPSSRRRRGCMRINQRQRMIVEKFDDVRMGVSTRWQRRHFHHGRYAKAAAINVDRTARRSPGAPNNPPPVAAGAGAGAPKRDVDGAGAGVDDEPKPKLNPPPPAGAGEGDPKLNAIVCRDDACLAVRI